MSEQDMDEMHEMIEETIEKEKKSIFGGKEKDKKGGKGNLTSYKLSRFIRLANWPVAARIALTITLLVTASLAVVTFIATRNIQSAMTKSISENFKIEAVALGNQVGGFFKEKISILQALGEVHVITDALEERNEGYSGSEASILRQIQALDEQWINAGDTNPLIQFILSDNEEINPATHQIVDFAETFHDHAEIFITDRYGANIGASDRTSDYYQADEGWWQAAWNDGAGAVYLSDPEYDESTDTTGVLVALPVYSEETGEILGIIRSTLILNDLFEIFEDVGIGQTGHAVLFDSSGGVIFEGIEEGEESSSDLPADLLIHLLQEEAHTIVALDNDGDESIFGHDRISALGEADDLEDEIDISFEIAVADAVEKLSWVAVVRQETSDALLDISKLTSTLVLVGTGTAFVSLLIGILVTNALMKPLSILSAAAEDLGSGNLDVRADVQSADEFGVLASAFNKMADELQSTLEGLEVTVETRTHDLNVRAKELQERAVEMEASQRVTFAASESTTPDDLLNLVVNLIRDQFNLYHAQVYMLNEKKDVAVLKESTGYAGRVLLQRNHQIALDQQSLVTTAIRDAEAVLVAETTKDPNWLPNDLLPETQSELVVPLILEGEVIGALDIQSRESGYFTERSIPIFEQMMNQVSFLFENSELVEDVTAQTKNLELFSNQLRMAAEVAASLNAITDLDELLEEAVNQLQTRFGWYHAHIYLLDETGESLIMKAGSGQQGFQLKRQGHSIPMDREASLVARAARTLSPVIANDTKLEAEYMPNPLLPNTRSEISLPLILGDRLLGILDIQDDEINRFSERDRDTLMTLAGNLASSIESARQYQAAQQERARYQTLVEYAPEAISVFSGETGLFVEANQNTVKLFGYSAEELIGKKHAALDTSPEFQPDGRPSEEAAVGFITETLNGGTPVFEWTHMNRAGDLIPCEIRLVRLPGEGAPLIRASITNISDRKAAQDALIQGDQLKSDFLANMSHELRTPLNSIIGYTDVLLMGLDGELEEEIVTDIQAIHDNGQHLLSLINDILDLAKIEAGRMTLDVSPVDVPGLYEEIKKNAAGLLFNKPVEMVVDVTAGLAPITADRHRIYQVITNLVSNAVKFTDEGQITLRAFQDGGHLVMEVQDTGVGIDEEALAEIFDEFTQADTSSTRQYEGTGLGLTITRRLVHMHQGTITVVSEVGIGSTFTLRIPYDAEFKPEHVSEAPVPQSANGTA